MRRPGVRALAAAGAMLALLLAGCTPGAGIEPTPSPGHGSSEHPAEVDLSALPERVEVAGSLREVSVDYSGRSFVVLRTAQGVLPVVLRLDGHDDGGPLGGIGGRAVVIAAPSGFVLPGDAAAAFVALEALATETGGALQVVGTRGFAAR